MPHCDEATCATLTCIAPSWTACPFVNLSSAACAMLNPLPAWSIAVTRMDTPVVGNVKFQHVPQFAEPKPAIAEEPPILGNVGNEPKVGKRPARPVAPVEHATVSVEPAALSYVLSKEARWVCAREGTARRRADATSVSFMLGIWRRMKAGSWCWLSTLKV